MNSRIKIHVEKITLLQGSGSLKAFASVSISNKITIHNCRIIQRPGQRAWVSMPLRESHSKDGQHQFFPIIEVPKSLRAAISSAVLTVWREQK